MIPFIDLAAQYRALKEEIDAAIQRVLDHGQYILGPEVAALENALAARVGTRHCVTLGSGTDALLIALMTAGVRAGDEVIVPGFTFAATAEVACMLGATPVLADIDRDSCNISVDSIASLIGPRTRAIIPVGLYGQPADMAAIADIAAQHDLVVVEDAAQSFGASVKDRQSCSLSAIGCTSFFPSKPLGCYGDGGALFTDDDEVAAIARELRVHGQSGRYHHTRIGMGARMDTIQCAVVLAKLSRFDWEVARRQAIGARYDRLCDERGIARVQRRPGTTSVFAQYTVFIDNRDAVRAALAAEGIPTAVHYPAPLSRQPAYAPIARFGALPGCDWAADHVLSLPMHANLDEPTQDRIVAALGAALGK